MVDMPLSITAEAYWVTLTCMVIIVGLETLCRNFTYMTKFVRITTARFWYATHNISCNRKEA